MSSTAKVRPILLVRLSKEEVATPHWREQSNAGYRVILSSLFLLVLSNLPFLFQRLCGSNISAKPFVCVYVLGLTLRLCVLCIFCSISFNSFKGCLAGCMHTLMTASLIFNVSVCLWDVVLPHYIQPLPLERSWLRTQAPTQMTLAT